MEFFTQWRRSILCWSWPTLYARELNPWFSFQSDYCVCYKIPSQTHPFCWNVPFVENIVMDCLGSSNLSIWQKCSEGTNYPSSESGFNSFRFLIVNCFVVIFDKVLVSQQNDCEYSKWLQYVPILCMETLCWVLQLHGATMLFVTNWKTTQNGGYPCPRVTV